MADKKILIVDDEKDFIANVQEYFRSYNASCVFDPKEALRKINQNFYDIIAVDYRLPDTTGIDLLIAAKKNKSYRFGILFTAFANKEILDNVMSNNLISHFIEKPFRLSKFKEIIDKLILECEKQVQK